MFSNGFTSLSVSFLFPLSVLILFHLTSDFDLHHDWLTYSGRTDRPSEVCYNFYNSNDLIQLVNFPTPISDCDSHSPALLNLSVSSDASICSIMAFPPLGNSDYVVVLVSIDFPTN